MGTSNLSSDLHFSTTHLLQLAENSGAISAGFDSTGFQGFEPGDGNSLFFNRSKLLKRLENFPSVGAQPTCFRRELLLGRIWQIVFAILGFWVMLEDLIGGKWVNSNPAAASAWSFLWTLGLRSATENFELTEDFEGQQLSKDYRGWNIHDFGVL